MNSNEGICVDGTQAFVKIHHPLSSRGIVFLLAWVAALHCGAAAAASLYWDGTAANWGNASSWSTSQSASTPDPDAPPVAADTAVFSVDGVTARQEAALDGDRAVSKILVRDIAAGGVAISGGDEDRMLSVGTGGIAVEQGAGPVSIGSREAGRGVNVFLADSQIWTNGCAFPITFENNIAGTATAALTLRGAGAFAINGSNSLTTTFTVKPGTSLLLGNDNALGTGTFIPEGAHVFAEDFPRKIANKVRYGDGSSYWKGEGALELSGNGANPAVANGQYKVGGFHVHRTAPMIVSGRWSLCDIPSGPNNSGVGPTMGSGANVTISGDITDFNNGSAPSVDNRAVNFKFLGAGANLTLTGPNSVGAGIANSATVVPIPGAGYNSITVGRPAGGSTTITPFGGSALSANIGVGVFLKSNEDGLVMANGLALGGSANNGGIPGFGAIPFGFDGEHDLTIAGYYRVSSAVGSVAFPNIATGTLTFSGAISNGVRTLMLLGSGDTVLAPSSVLTGTPGGFTKFGSGALTMTGVNEISGTTKLRGGSVVVDCASGDTNMLGRGTSASALAIGGVDIQLDGGNSTQVLGAGGGTTIEQGSTRIRRTGGGTSTLNMGAITRAIGALGAVDFEPGVASTTTANANGILGGNGYATVNGADWAVGGGVISAFTAYDSLENMGTDKNILLQGSSTVGYTGVGTLKIAPTNANESLSINGYALTVARSGLLFTGDHDYTIYGNNIRGRDVYLGELIVHQHAAGALDIASTIIGYSLVKTGPGLLVLSSPANAMSTSLAVVDGAVQVSENGSLGASGAVTTLDGGALRTTNSFANLHKVVLGPNGGTFNVVSGSLDQQGVISGNYGALDKTGLGTLVLSGDNTYVGPTTVREGVLQLGHDRGLSYASTNRVCSVSPVAVMDGGTLDLAGHSSYIGNFRLEGGTVSDSVGGGLLGAYSFTLSSGEIGAALVDVTVPNTENVVNSVNLFKRTGGTAVLTAANTYSGTTFVDAGALQVDGSLEASAAIVGEGGTLCGNGALKRTVNVEGGVIAPGPAASGVGSLALGRHLRMANGATMKIAVGSAGAGRVAMTSQDARVLLEGASLDIQMLSGAIPPLLAGVTIIDNQGTLPVEGQFAGLPEGGEIELVNGRKATISYVGGDGNDIVLSIRERGTLLQLR